ncbi:serine/threonine-protein kinase [Nonomuraea endophytica]|uniref:non-specific serine/threonine protein kinase n=1 Tax=Nonomuraea endophytica TaxID=714136 RepID=A0A7W8A274_9ACTN|nr:serine/threonine-protein kinase [Nonomuraea endophytica]MBB5078148.1 serine/threonine protein kinase [Nonomuraea endophytica]
MQHVEDAPGYRVLDQAGQGGFAIVYRAYQERLDRVVALKVLSVDRVDSRTMRRFQRELQLTGRLTGHPNVVTVFDTGTTRSGKPYIAMDFFENGSLRDRIRNNGPLPLQEVLRSGVKLAGALAAVHEAGVLHGDIKPQNILISRYGEPAIADFGVARVIDTAEVSASTHAFTPLHAAPEVLSGHQHTAATDIYSLGSTLYHLLAGQPAFHSPTDPSIAPLMYRVLSSDPPPIDRADVPAVVFSTVMRAMAKDPQQRYGTAREFAERLQRIQAELGLPVTDLLGADPGPSPAPRPDAPSGPQTHPATYPATAPADPNGPAQAPAYPPASPSPWAPGSTYPVTGAHADPVSPWAPHRPPTAPLGGQATSPWAPQSGVPLAAQAPQPQGAQAPLAQAAAAGQPGGGGPAVPGGRRRKGGGSSGRGKIVIGVAVAAVALAGTGVAVYLSQRPSGTVPTAGRTELKKPTTPTVDRKSIDALRPRLLKVSRDQGVSVTLTWRLPSGAREYPLVVQREPSDGEPLVPLPAGTTSTRLTGLTKDGGYCFLVGVPLQFSEKTSVAWSKPTCIRGARPGGVQPNDAAAPNAASISE